MRTMRYYAQVGVIPAIRSGRRCWKFKLGDLLAFNESRAVAREISKGALISGDAARESLKSGANGSSWPASH
jgi:hypothetical protein